MDKPASQQVWHGLILFCCHLAPRCHVDVIYLTMVLVCDNRWPNDTLVNTISTHSTDSLCLFNCTHFTLKVSHTRLCHECATFSKQLARFIQRTQTVKQNEHQLASNFVNVNLHLSHRIVGFLKQPKKDLSIHHFVLILCCLFLCLFLVSVPSSGQVVNNLPFSSKILQLSSLQADEGKWLFIFQFKIFNVKKRVMNVSVSITLSVCFDLMITFVYMSWSLCSRVMDFNVSRGGGRIEPVSTPIDDSIQLCACVCAVNWLDGTPLGIAIIVLH